MKLVTLLTTALLVAACSAGVGAGAASVPPTNGAAATAAVTSDPTAQSGQPPGASLSAAGTAVPGHLGTYCWSSICADEFDTPPAAELPLVAASSEDLVLALDGGASFLSWSAGYRSDEDEQRISLGSGGSDFDPDTDATAPPALSQATFATPPPGDWVVIVQVFSEEGDAQYLWHVAVD